MYSSQPGELLAGRCTLVQLTTIQLIRRFPYSCTAHNQVNSWLVAVPLYSSQPYNLLEDFRTHVCTAHNQVNSWLVAVPMYSSQPYNLSEDFRTHVLLTTR